MKKPVSEVTITADMATENMVTADMAIIANMATAAAKIRNNQLLPADVKYLLLPEGFYYVTGKFVESYHKITNQGTMRLYIVP